MTRGAVMADRTESASGCSNGRACCGRCTAGRDPALQDLLHEIQALGAVLPGQSGRQDDASPSPQPAHTAGSDPWQGGDAG